MARDRDTIRTVAQNRKARHRFHILDTLECGLALRGTEVKSLRAGHGSIQEAYGLVRKGELWLIGATIPEYSHGNIHNHPPDRDRKLLLSARELSKWDQKVREKGMTVVPLHLYFRGHLVKVEMALVKGKRFFDKREDQRQKDARREMDRALHRRR